jgi:hypothetical protein
MKILGIILALLFFAAPAWGESKVFSAGNVTLIQIKGEVAMCVTTYGSYHTPASLKQQCLAMAAQYWKPGNFFFMNHSGQIFAETDPGFTYPDGNLKGMTYFYVRIKPLTPTWIQLWTEGLGWVWQ